MLRASPEEIIDLTEEVSDRYLVSGYEMTEDEVVQFDYEFVTAIKKAADKMFESGIGLDGGPLN